MSRPLPSRAVSGVLCLIAAVSLGGCAGLSQVSIHDQELATAALQAQSAFAGATSDDVWTTMLDNLERSAPVEREVLVSAMNLRFEGQLQDIETLTWRQIKECAEGGCDVSSTQEVITLTGETDLTTSLAGSTSDKIAQTAARMAEIGEEIEALSKHMRDDPSGANETGMLTEAPTSPLADAIAEVEEGVQTLEAKLDAAKEERLDQLQEALRPLEETFKNLGLSSEANDRLARIRQVLETRIGEIRGALAAVTDYDQLAATAAIRSEELLRGAGIELNQEADPAIKRLIRNAFDEFFDPLRVHIDATGELLTEAEGLIGAALGEGTPPSERLATIADLLRKAEHLDLVKADSLADVLEGATNHAVSGDVAEALGVSNVGQLLQLIEQGDERIAALADKISIQRLFDELRSEPLSMEFAGALKRHTDQDIGSIGALLDYLGTDESRIQEVRVALMTDWRRAVVEGRALQLESLRYRLGLLRELAGALAAQQVGEQGLDAQLQTALRCVRTMNLDDRAFDTLDSIAAGRALPPSQQDCREAYGRPRDQFYNLLAVVGDHFTRIGYLHDNERLADYEIVRYEHRRSIEASRLAAAAHEQLIEHGLQGLVAFTQGGITTEQVATVLRFINVGLLSVIANQE